MDDLLKKYPSTDVFQANMLKNTQKKRIKSRLKTIYKFFQKYTNPDEYIAQDITELVDPTEKMNLIMARSLYFEAQYIISNIMMLRIINNAKKSFTKVKKSVLYEGGGYNDVKDILDNYETNITGQLLDNIEKDISSLNKTSRKVGRNNNHSGGFVRGSSSFPNHSGGFVRGSSSFPVQDFTF